MVVNVSELKVAGTANESLFVCGICEENYNSNKLAPITLHCGHTFCRNCIEQLGKEFDDHVPCGICMTNSWTSVKKLSKNFQMLEILDKYALLNDMMGFYETKDLSTIKSDVQVNTVSQANESGETVGSNAEALESDESEQVLNLIRESIEVLRNGLDTISHMSRQLSVIKTLELHRIAANLFVDIDEVAFHPLLDLLRSAEIRSDEDRRLRELVHRIMQNSDEGRHFLAFIESYNGNLNNERLRIIIAEYRHQYANHHPERLPEEMVEQILHELEIDGESASDNYSMETNSDNLTSGREIGSSVAGSELDKRDEQTLSELEFFDEEFLSM